MTSPKGIKHNDIFCKQSYFILHIIYIYTNNILFASNGSCQLLYCRHKQEWEKGAALARAHDNVKSFWYYISLLVATEAAKLLYNILIQVEK